MPVLRFIRRRIALKLTLTLVGFVGISVLAAGFYLNDALGDFAVESIEARLVSVVRLLEPEARGALHGGAGAGAQAFVQRVARATGARVTLIDADGRVVAESERDADTVSQLENHRDRPEVRTALEGRIGRNLRQSATVDAPLLYVARPVSESGRVSGVLRLALPLSGIIPAAPRRSVARGFDAVCAVLLVTWMSALLLALSVPTAHFGVALPLLYYAFLSGGWIVRAAMSLLR